MRVFCNRRQILPLVSFGQIFPRDFHLPPHSAFTVIYLFIFIGTCFFRISRFERFLRKPSDGGGSVGGRVRRRGFM